MDPLPSPPRLVLRRLPGRYAVARPTVWPEWLPADGFVSVSRTANEVSVVCEEQHVPEDVKVERNWAVFEFEGPFPFGLTGILDSVIHPLAQARIPVFALSTYDTDYLLVKVPDLTAVRTALESAGHTIHN